jgi:hypothetical protein
VRRAEIISLLRELGERLEARGLAGEMYVVGGAAIALAFDERRSTADVDAVFEPKLEIYAAAAGARCRERRVRLPSRRSRAVLRRAGVRGLTSSLLVRKRTARSARAAAP